MFFLKRGNDFQKWIGFHDTVSRFSTKLVTVFPQFNPQEAYEIPGLFGRGLRRGR